MTVNYEKAWQDRAKTGVGNVARAERAATMERVRAEQERTRAAANPETLAATTTETVATAGKKPEKPAKRAYKRAEKRETATPVDNEVRRVVRDEVDKRTANKDD